MKIHYSDEALIRGLKEKNEGCIGYLYREFFPLAKSVVEKNSGTVQDAEDVFQDGVVVLYLKARENSLDLKCSLKTFFYSVCRNIWLQRLDRKWRLLYTADMVSEPSEEYNSPGNVPDEEELERTRLYQVHFLSLPRDCQRLLKMFIRNISLEEIAKKMGYASGNYAKHRKYLCKNFLRKRILNDPRCQHLIYP